MAGLRGIPDARGRVLRPLWEIPRSEIEGWLEKRGLDYRVDSTNRDPSFLRNAVRHRLLPVAAEVFPGYSGTLARFSELMRSLASLLRSEARKRLQWREEPGGWSIDCEGFFRVPYLLRLESLYERIDRWGPAFRRIPERFFRVLQDAEKLENRRVLLAGRGLILRRREGRLFLERDIVGGRKKGYFIPVRRGFTVPVCDDGLGFALRAEPWEGAGGSGGEPLVFRSAQAGDSIRTHGGCKAVRKLFGEWKIPHSERWRVPIVDSRSGILAVLGGPLGYTDRFREGLCQEMRSFLKAAVEFR